MKPQTKIQTILLALDAMSPVAFAKTRTERMLGEELNEFAVDKNGWTHLHWAAVANDAHSALRLLELGARPDSKNNGGADFGPEVKHRFAVLGLGDVEWWEEGETPLEVAMRVCALSAASVLITRGANVNAKNKFGVTPLHWAAGHNAPEVAELLISNGADVNAKGRGCDTPLHWAAGKNALEVAELLISNGANVNATGWDGVTPLHRAVDNKATKVAELLINNGADVNAKGRGCDTPLHWAVLQNAPEVAELLISNGADVNALKSDGALLHYAATCNATKVAEVLINAGADVNEGYGVFMPLHKAAGANAPEVAEVLINSGANVNAKDKFGRTPLHWAATDKATKVAEVLINAGADVNAKDRPGRTPLHWAEMRSFGASEVVTMLISNGAIVDAKDNSGRAPSDYAADWGRGINKMRPDGLLFTVLCCLHARPELGLLLFGAPPLLETSVEAEPVESVLSRLRFHGLEFGDSTWDVEAWLAQDGFWGVMRQVQESRRYVDGGADPEEDFHHALRALGLRHDYAGDTARRRFGFRMRPERLLFSVLCCLHARPELGLGLEKLPPLLGTVDEAEVVGTVDEAEAVESALSRLRFRTSDGDGEAEGGDMNVVRWLLEDGFVGVARQVQEECRRYVAGGADPEEDFHCALRSLERRHAEKTGAGKSAWLEKIRHDAEEDYDIPPLS